MRHTSWLLLAVALVLGPVLRADPCTDTDCTFTFDEHNSSFTGITSSGPYGTVELVQTAANVITFHINMDPNYVLINTGFSGVFGFNDNVGSTLTVDNLIQTGYSGYAVGGGQKFDGFGQNWDDAVATTGPHAGSSDAVSGLSFTVTNTGGNFTSIYDLVGLATPEGGDGPAYFVADVYDKKCGSGACTGLVGVSGIPSGSVPEPASTIPAAVGLAAFTLIATRKRQTRNASL